MSASHDPDPALDTQDIAWLKKKKSLWSQEAYILVRGERQPPLSEEQRIGPVVSDKEEWSPVGSGGVSHQVVRKVLFNEETLSEDLKEVREEVTQITETGVFQTVGTVSIKPLSSSVLGGASQKDRTAGVREGGTVGPCDHLFTEKHTEHLLWAMRPRKKQQGAIQPWRRKHTHSWLRTQNPGRITWGEQDRIVQTELKEDTKESGEIPVAWEHLRRYRRKWKCSLILKGGRIPIGWEKRGPGLFNTSTVPGT